MEEQGTRCPNCQLVFRVASSQLKAAEGMVRCGICLATFDAVVNRIDVEQAEPSQAPAWLDVGDNDQVIDDSFDPDDLEDGLSRDDSPGHSLEEELQVSDLDLSVLESGAGLWGDEVNSTEEGPPPDSSRSPSDSSPSFSDEPFEPFTAEPEPEFDIPESSEVEVLGQEIPGAVLDDEFTTEPTDELIDGDELTDSVPPPDKEAVNKAIEELEIAVFGEKPSETEISSRANYSNSDEALDQNQALPLPSEDRQKALSFDLTLAGAISIDAQPEGSQLEDSQLEDLQPEATLAEETDHSANTIAALNLPEMSPSERLNEFVVQGQKTGRSTRRLGSLAAAMLVIMGLGLLAGQWFFFRADQLSQREEYAGLYGSLCQALPCRGSEFSDLSVIQTRNLVVRTHPRYEGALKIDAMLVNLAGRSQNFPGIILIFEDLQGAVLARRRFKPEEYLKGDMAGVKVMPSRQPVHFALDIIDPGELAVSYTLLPTH